MRRILMVGATTLLRKVRSLPTTVIFAELGLGMRITIEIDDELLNQALALTKAKTKKELIHRSLEALIRQQRIERLLGKLGRFPLQLTPGRLARLRADD
jgi:hypothetical protein